MPDATGQSKTKKDPRKLIRRLSARSAEVRWVIRALEQQLAAEARIGQADLKTESEAARKRAREAKAAGVKIPAAAIPSSRVELHPGTASQALKPWKRALAPANAALGGEIRSQLARLRSAVRDRDRLEATVGDPTTFLCLFRADSVTATASPVHTSGTTNVIPPTPIAQNSVSARNRARFAARSRRSSATSRRWRRCSSIPFTSSALRPASPRSARRRCTSKPTPRTACSRPNAVLFLPLVPCGALCEAHPQPAPPGGPLAPRSAGHVAADRDLLDLRIAARSFSFRMGR